MSFPPRFLDDIRARASLADVISKRVKLTRKGREHVGLCPFHNEKSPSFTVNEDKGFYHCFGCGAHGDVISFVMNTQGSTFPEAVERLAAEAGLEVPVESPEERERSKLRAGLHDVMEMACRWYQQRLHDASGRDALDYLRGRSLDDKTISRFRLGYAPGSASGGDSLEAALRAQGVTPEQLLEAGLMRRPDDGRAPYPFFRDRVMFPIADRRGRVIAFGGRVMGEAKAAKYLNSPDTPLFDKGRTLYNAAAAREALQEHKGESGGDLVVVEGYMDVIALSRAGMNAAVAPLGTAMTEDHLGELWRLTPEPVLCFDGDTAGQRAAGRAAERALPVLRPGKSLRFAVLPTGEDPDSLIATEGPAAMRRIIESARPLSDLLWDMEAHARPVDTPERRADLEARLNGRVREIADESVQGHYRTMFKDRLWAAFRGRGGSRQNNQRGSGGRGPERGANGGGAVGNPGAHVLARTAPLRANRRRQQAILATLINQPVLRDEIDEVLAGFEFDPDLDNLRQQLQNLFSNDWGLDVASIKAHLEIGDSARVLEGVLSSQVYQLAPFARPDALLDDARRVIAEIFGRSVFERQKEELRDLGRSTTDEAKVFAAGREAVENDRRLADIDD
ncbi:MAG: DNA primase [Rhodospirillaceae bacterium]|jgi:DNA primase|nr:DNA primase [Rhodospirillaceae bacterium]